MARTVWVAAAVIASVACGKVHRDFGEAAAGGMGTPSVGGDGGVNNGGASASGTSSIAGGDGGSPDVGVGGHGESGSPSEAAGTGDGGSRVTEPPGGEGGMPDTVLCGNGRLDGSEQCDDGDHLAGDGCSGTCNVEPGWTCSGAPTSCKDVDECVSRTDNCSVNADCTNTVGSFKCTCKTGFVGDGFNCTPSIATGQYHACAILSSGGVKCWGYNASGQLGDGTTVGRGTAVAVVGLGTDHVSQIAAGADHTCALLTSGAIKCWGSDAYGQLGDGSLGDAKGDRLAPTSVPSLQNVRQIAAGGFHSCALVDGSVECWGYDVLGQLGDGTAGDNNGNRLVPVTVPLGQSAVQVVAGYAHSCALLEGGAVKCWGWDIAGQLGDGTTGDVAKARLVPVQVLTLDHGVRQLAAGSNHTCALLTTGGVECWGLNASGELGNATTVVDMNAKETAPVPVSTLASGVVQIAAGAETTCALLTSGGVKCWGDDTNGASGDGTKGDANQRRVAPVQVATLTQGVVQVAAGSDIGCALLATGGVKCWGGNEFQDSGTGAPEGTLVLTPTSVSGVP